MSLQGYKVLLTGASGGIGKAIAKTLAAQGAELILFGGTNEVKLENVAKKIKTEFPDARLKYIPCDLTDDIALKNAYSEIKDERIDALINNAGVGYGGSFEKTDMATFDKIMAINFRAPVALTKLVLPNVKMSDKGTIINIASVVAHNGYPDQSAYVASKHALLGFSKSLAAELYRQGIRVHVVSPGGVYTDMIKITRPDLTGEDMIMPEDVANAVLFLLGNRTNAVIDEIRMHRANKQPFL